MPATIENKILELKKQRNAVILAHNYQRGEVQDISDFTGDSLGLSQTAAKTDAEVVVFCGVHFMAETAAILCPDKMVLLPDPEAGCPMADMITPEDLAGLKQNHPDALVVTYVNSSAAIKAMSDVCCTSANAVEVVSALPEDRSVIFIPDRNLGHYTARMTGRNLILWDGYCPTHERILPDEVREAQQKRPYAELVVHPECRPEVVAMADKVASTAGMLKHCRESNASAFLIGTEVGLLHGLRKENPSKLFHALSPVATCPNMKLVTLEKLLWSLEDGTGQVVVTEEIAEKARISITAMLDIGKLIQNRAIN